jgi:hypothetical protein
MRQVTEVPLHDPFNPKWKEVQHYHCILVVLSVKPTPFAYGRLKVYLDAHIGNYGSEHTQIFNYLQATEISLHHRIKNEVVPVFNANKKMPIVLTHKDQIIGSNAFKAFTGCILIGCMESKTKNKYHQEQCDGRLARPLKPNVGDVVPLKDQYVFRHLVSELTQATSQQRVNVDFEGLSKRSNTMRDPEYVGIYNKLKHYGSEHVAKKYASNFFFKKDRQILPLRSDGSDWSRNFVDTVKQYKDNSWKWQQNLIQYLKNLVSAKTNKDDCLEAQEYFD